MARTRASTFPAFLWREKCIHMAGCQISISEIIFPYRNKNVNFIQACGHGFAQRIHYLSFGCKNSILPLFLQAFFAKRLAGKIGITLRKIARANSRAPQLMCESWYRRSAPETRKEPVKTVHSSLKV